MSVAGRRILVVEDDWLIGEALRESLAKAGAVVLGPASSVADAFALLDEHDPPDAAVLDVNLRGGEVSFPVAQRLLREGVRVVFATDSVAPEVQAAFSGVPVMSKPLSVLRLARLLGWA